MVVMILERVPTGLKGELSRWLIEPRAGVFVGSVSALVCDRLWEKVCDELGDAGEGGALLLYNARNEQGLAFRTVGDPSRTPVDWEGLMLIRTPEPAHRAPRRRPAATPDPQPP